MNGCVLLGDDGWEESACSVMLASAYILHGSEHTSNSEAKVIAGICAPNANCKHGDRSGGEQKLVSRQLSPDHLPNSRI